TAMILAGAISHGERKLLDVAVAYALRPKLLFLDEPTSGVSTREKAPIMDIVSSIVRSGGITVVIIEHDMDIVFRYSERIVVMHQGSILADGTPDEIRQNDAVTTTLLGIGYAPEDAGIFPDLSVAENFHICEWLARPVHRSEGRPGSSDVEDRVFAVFPEVKAFMQRRGLHLSGGQKKMVAIARAMALSPSILLLDEPFEGLAPLVVTRFIDAVKKIKAMGISLLIAASKLMTAIRIADRLYAIDRGEIIF